MEARKWTQEHMHIKHMFCYSQTVSTLKEVSLNACEAISLGNLLLRDTQNWEKSTTGDRIMNL